MSKLDKIQIKKLILILKTIFIGTILLLSFKTRCLKYYNIFQQLINLQQVFFQKLRAYLIGRIAFLNLFAI